LRGVSTGEENLIRSLDDAGRYPAETGMIEMLGHDNAEVWVYKSRKTGKIKHTYNEAIAEDGDVPH